MLYIKPAALVTQERIFEGHAVLVEGNLISEVGPAQEIVCPPGALHVDADDLTLVPGFLDLQINGAFGRDFTATPSAIWDVGSALPRFGVTTFLPTIITSPPESVAAAQSALLHGPPAGYRGAIPLGLHLEGPFLNPAKRGAHSPAHLRPPNLDAVAAWSPSEGVRMVTLAPELPGALQLIQSLVARGIVVSVGHSMATLSEAQSGLEAGVTYGTHLFNAMPLLDHREPGLVGALLANERVVTGIIADGVHLHPDIIALAWRLKGHRRLSLITDAMAALGMPPAVYRLGDQDVLVRGEDARLADGRLAGSILSLDQAVRNLLKFTGSTLAEAIATVTAVPANLLGLGNSHGRIAPGYVADMTLLTKELQVVTTIVGGRVVYPGV